MGGKTLGCHSGASVTHVCKLAWQMKCSHNVNTIININVAIGTNANMTMIKKHIEVCRHKTHASVNTVVEEHTDECKHK